MLIEQRLRHHPRRTVVQGYSTGSGEITTHFYAGTGNGIKNLKADAGIDGNLTVDLEDRNDGTAVYEAVQAAFELRRNA